MRRNYKKRPKVSRYGTKKTSRGRSVRTGNTLRRKTNQERGRKKRNLRQRKPLKRR